MTPFYAQVDVMLDVVGMCQSIKEFFCYNWTDIIEHIRSMEITVTYALHYPFYEDW